MVLVLSGGAAVWHWQRQARASAPITLRTFEPMAGDWEGTVSLTRDGLVSATGWVAWAMTASSFMGAKTSAWRTRDES